MADGRFLSRSIAVNERLAGVSMEADYLYTRCIPHLDVDGRLTANPKVLKATVAPLRDEIAPELIPVLLTELDRVGLVVWYDLDGRQFLEFPGFREHQRGLKPEREAPSKIPSSQSQGVQRVRTSSGSTQELVRTNSGSTPPKLSEVKSREVKNPRKEPRGDSTAVDETTAVPAKQGSWLEPSRAAYEAVYGAGTFPFKMAGNHLKPLRTAGHTAEQIAANLSRYLAKTTDAQYLNLAKFAQTFSAWDDPGPTVDPVTRLPTAYGQRLLGIAK